MRGSSWLRLHTRWSKGVPRSNGLSDEWVCGCDHVLCVSAVALKEDSHDERARAVAREIKRRTKAVGAFPDRAKPYGSSPLVALKVTAKWSDRRYVDVSLLENQEVDQAA